eukprot:13582-Pelagococcus_subviridis.AAC.1
MSGGIGVRRNASHASANRRLWRLPSFHFGDVFAAAFRAAVAVAVAAATAASVSFRRAPAALAASAARSAAAASPTLRPRHHAFSSSRRSSTSPPMSPPFMRPSIASKFSSSPPAAGFAPISPPDAKSSNSLGRFARTSYTHLATSSSLSRSSSRRPLFFAAAFARVSSHSFTTH